ncbi:MAG TPA: BamA/TamA family outer membrane protein [Longimicrobium sp.]|nr:BamA/TamA family outer membrane protein [Longimicrobium sp.]
MLARATRGTLTLPLLLRAAALPLVLFALAACAAGGGPSGPFPGLQQYQGREIHAVDVSGDFADVPRDSVRSVVATRASRCSLLGFLPVCLPLVGGRVEERLDTQVLARDVVRIQLVFRDNGYYGTRVVPTVDDAGDGKIDVRFNVIPGERVLLRTLDVSGAEAIVADSDLVPRLPLKVNEPFRRNQFLASVDTVRNALLDRGYAYAQVLRNYQIDTIADVADVNLQAAPGPLVRVDSIIFEGLDRVSERIARQQITFREGSLLRSRDLLRSQRNLYDLELIRFATVEVAPESLQVTRDSAQLLEDSIGSTVLIRVGEAPRYAVDASVGYGTVDCFRGSVQHTDRNFLGGARRLQLTGSVGKVGVANPLDAGLESSLCRAFRIDTTTADSVDIAIAHALNYRLAGELVQPRLFGTRNSITLGAFTEQISELGLYVRKDAGGQVALIRDLGPGTLLSTTYTAERGSTRAHDLFFCVVYEVCRREEIDILQEPRWSNNLSAALIRTRVRLNPFPTGGYQFRVGTDVAGGILGSDDEYLRLLGDGSVYKSVGGNKVVQVRLLAGTFLNGVLGSGFIPPQRLFYAGGATTVRGFRRNELGPVIYVARPSLDNPEKSDTIPSATGGRRLLVGTVEVTAPSPFFRQRLRLAAFVDGGRVWAADSALTSPPFRFTPGAGVRIATPVGPGRLDLSYNPYPAPTGPLYQIDSNGNIVGGVVNPDFKPSEGKGFFRRLTVHVSIGQTF